MEKEDFIKEFDSFLRELETKYSLPSSGGTISGVEKRINALYDNIKLMNQELTDKVNNLLTEYKGDDSGELKEILVKTSKEFIISHLKR